MRKRKKSQKKASYILISIGLLLVIASFTINKTFIEESSNKIRTIVQEPVENVLGDKTADKVEGEGDKRQEVVEDLPVSSKFTAKSYLLYDLNSSEIVGGKDVDKKLPNASTTKLMTAYIAVNTYPLNRQLPVTEECIGIEGNNVGFSLGDSFYVEDLLYGLLLRSASDASCVFTSNFEGGTSSFIERMNTEAKNLDLENTNYTNAIGLDAENHYSSSNDLLKLILKLKDIEKLKIIMGSRDFTLRDMTYGNKYYVSNTNRLLFDLPGTVGYKTGFTSSAGECLVFGYNNFGTELIVVVMGSLDRFYDAKHLLDLYLIKTGKVEEAGTVEATSSIRVTEEVTNKLKN